MLNTERRLLLQDGIVVDVQPLVFELVSFLARRSRRVVSKAELLPAVWRTTFVTETVVARAVMKARRALGDDAQSPRLLRTVPRVGYFLDADVQERQSAEVATRHVEALADGRSRLALLPLRDLTGNAALEWVGQGLTELLQLWVEDAEGDHLVSRSEVQRLRTQVLASGDPMAALTAGLGVAEVVRPELSWSDGVLVLRAWRGAAQPGVLAFEERGADAITLARHLADALAGPAGVPTRWQVDSFWLEQLGTAMSLQQGGGTDRALALLESCLPHLPASLPLRLLHARLLHHSGRLAEAIAQVDAALASDPVPERPMIRLELLALRAQSEFEADRLPQARADFEQALALSSGLPQARALRPELLSRAARVAGRQLDAHQAIVWSEAAVAEAEKLGQLEVQARAWLVLTGMLRAMDLPHRAEEAGKRAFELAERSGVVEFQGRALRSQAALHHYRREYRPALVCVRKSVSLWLRCGDRLTLLWTRLFEATILVDSLALTEATALLDDLQRQTDLQPAQKGFMQYLRAQIDWCEGRGVPALERLRVLVQMGAQSKSLFMQVARAELVLMAIELNHLDEARQFLATASGLHFAGAVQRRQAALALAEGDRAGAIAQLRSVWDSGPSLGIEGLLIAVDLGWLLLETAPVRFEDPALETLFAHVLDFSEEAPEVRLFRAGYLLRQRPDAHSRAEWDAVVSALPALARRCPMMLTRSYREAMASRSPPRLQILLSRICR